MNKNGYNIKHEAVACIHHVRTHPFRETLLARRTLKIHWFLSSYKLQQEPLEEVVWGQMHHHKEIRTHIHCHMDRTMSDQPIDQSQLLQAV